MEIRDLKTAEFVFLLDVWRSFREARAMGISLIASLWSWPLFGGKSRTDKAPRAQVKGPASGTWPDAGTGKARNHARGAESPALSKSAAIEAAPWCPGAGVFCVFCDFCAFLPGVAETDA